MTILWFCLVLVALNILLVAWAARRAFRDPTAEARAERDRLKNFHEEEWLLLGDVIFDRSDYLWLKNETCFPDLAGRLARHRRVLALRWLRALGESFKELARTPAPEALGGWRLFWSGLRFQLLLNYALIVVLVSGPYHRIVPPVVGLSALFQRKPAPPETQLFH